MTRTANRLAASSALVLALAAPAAADGLRLRTEFSLNANDASATSLDASLGFARRDHRSGSVRLMWEKSLGDFRFEIQRYIDAERFNGKRTLKTYVIFLGHVHGKTEITPTEHPDFQWVTWQPPHQISEWLIDPLLHEVEKVFAHSPAWSSTQE